MLHDCGVDAIIGTDDDATNSIATGVWNFVHVRLCQVLKDVKCVYVEYQFPTWDKPMVYMSVKNTCIEIAFKSQFPPEMVKTVSPSAVKNRYKIATGSYNNNKSEVCTYVEQRLGKQLYNCFLHGIKSPDRHHVCDALMLALYGLEVSNRYEITDWLYANYDDKNLHDLRQAQPELHPGQQGTPLALSSSSHHSGSNERDRRDKSPTSRERTIPFFFPSRSRNQGKEPRRPSARKLKTKQ